MRKRLTTVFLGAGAATLLLGSCQRDDPEPSAPLLNTRWALQQIDTTPLAVSSYSHDYNSYIQFAGAGNQVQGLAACDALQGQFTLSADTKRLTISQLSVSQSTCPSPYVSNRYLTALPQTVRYEISRDTLRLYDAQLARPRLVFKAAP